MKLKKIVSLALAGVLAVSMLAGCSNDNGSSSSEVVPPVATTGIADALNDARDAYTEDILKLTYKESSSLTDILKAAAQDKYGKDVKTIKDNSGYAKANVVDGNDGIYTKIADQLVGTVKAVDKMNTAFSAEGTNKSLFLYTVGGDYAMAAVGNAVAKSVANYADYSLNTITDGFYLTGTNTKATYTADVAAVKVVSPDDATKSMWVVAVVYTQTVA